jgi:protein-S-isoprenylcysteine O-methyltransferase Ste14
MPSPRAASTHPFWPGVVALAGMILLPLLVYYLWLCVDNRDHPGALFLPAPGDVTRIPAPTATAAVVVAVWLSLQVLLQLFAPGKWAEGAPLADGARLRYRMNGLFAFCVSLLLFIVPVRLGWLSPTLVYDQFGPLLTTVNLFAFALSAFLYLFGRFGGRGDKATGNIFYGFFMGTELNPRIGALDLKFFLESRPGLIGWVIVDCSLAAQQLKEHGALTTPMCLVLAFQFLYVADYFFHEEAILSTWDIRHERLGWMLVWGDLVWVPFTYTLQAFYLIRHTHDLPWWGTAAIVALNLCGYAIFRSANWQKHQFRKNPDTPVWGGKPEFIRTANGGLLLTSGWWGVARHINYLGDLMMALAWCLPCGFEQPLPYFYFAYFLILLLHRERRDHAACQQKYGADWEVYCRKVRWRMIPYVY